MQSTIGERLKAVEPYLDDDEEFLATYGDGSPTRRSTEMVDAFRASGKLIHVPLRAPAVQRASWSSRTPTGRCSSVEDMSQSDVRINGGFFVCRRELLDWIEPGDELVEETFAS